MEWCRDWNYPLELMRNKLKIIRIIHEKIMYKNDKKNNRKNGWKNDRKNNGKNGWKNDNISPVRISSFSTENEDMKRCLSVWFSLLPEK